MIQIACIPSRMLLVYLTLYFLFPVFFWTNRYFKFFVMYCLLVLAISILIQRPLMLIFVQPAYLPNWGTNNFFGYSEIINTALDINIAAIIPLGHHIFKRVEVLKKSNKKLNQEKILLKENSLTPTLDVKVEKTIHKVLLTDILFIESQRNNIRIKLAKTELIARHNISTMENLLPKNTFIRVHRSFIINHGKVSSFSPTKIEIDDVSIPVGRKYKEVIKELLGYN
ncbi:LytR/AlgR family response regulator transcription factor [Saccharicrinis carchari]|nr:LytTR family DNA-binding domain-containing protein [Saccharicrinis carchari]